MPEPLLSSRTRYVIRLKAGGFVRAGATVPVCSPVDNETYWESLAMRFDSVTVAEGFAIGLGYSLREYEVKSVWR